MKKYLLPLLFLILASVVYSQDQPPQPQQPANVKPQQKEATQKSQKNHINSGFYFKFGGSIPLVAFAQLHQYPYLYKAEQKWDTIRFNRARLGAAMEMGFLIYLGPAFAANHIRLGIDATFLAVSFNPTDASLPNGTMASDHYQYWYYFGGQKFGPLVTINPVDYLMIDLSYKINATAAWYDSMFGMNLATNELSLGLRYRLMLFAFQYNWGSIKFTYNHADNPTYTVDNTTFRVLIGFKF